MYYQKKKNCIYIRVILDNLSKMFYSISCTNQYMNIYEYKKTIYLNNIFKGIYIYKQLSLLRPLTLKKARTSIGASFLKQTI